ncbi:SigE family RNA polymerase sigma factor [Streptomyces pluripotens]|uniref:SigE family RNA polymerase sigma factor n=1 Tax=Streptomyces pluripotens TaxID=1355015 RepID=A0A221P0L9_9ACTN|nr:MULTISPECIES: SigE family RNA polymerase sigma factor [Streptomyces]ARP71056.1 SigE family RNA polymerase sigma factor [Streptomyces pluripotens]ASN25305.1 SigE family RNA polymerase sigma factor [Streptomyces pluripotens]KIE25942.1 RNA polymerase [Streptomyces sp. MUSC 125]MCH0557174.1 SigE family RNA polymerase sigma factor [Streptomyces sp. MUM 16J]
MRPRENPPGRGMDEREFDAFYTASVGRLIGQLYAMTGDLAEAQDVVQEAFARAWERRSELDLNGAPEAWVRTVAWRMAVSRWRRVRTALAFARRQGPPAPVPPPEPHHVLLVQALRQIPEAQRHAVVLHHLCDLPVEQVAAETGRPVGTVKAQLSRGRAALARLLADTELDPRTTGLPEVRHG